ILFKLNKDWRIGASYRTDADIDFKGDATFTQIPTGSPQLDAIVKAGLPPNQNLTATIPFPAIAAIGIATSRFDKWDVEFDVTHTTWSRFKALDINFATTPANNLHRVQNWSDT